MARRRTHPPLSVYLNSRLVGQLRKAPGGAVDFQYDESWLSWESAFPVSLSLPLREDRYTGAPVIAVFDNLLPDNMDIRRRLAARTRADGADAYSLLTAIGRDCVGALQFLPEAEKPGVAGSIDARPVSDEEIAAMLGDLARSPLGLGKDEQFRISLAGAQEKTALLYWKGKWHVPHGTTATTHILKPGIGRREDGIEPGAFELVRPMVGKFVHDCSCHARLLRHLVGLAASMAVSCLPSPRNTSLGTPMTLVIFIRSCICQFDMPSICSNSQ